MANDCKYKRVMLLDDNELDNFVNQKLIEHCKFSEKIFLHTSAKSALEFFKNINLMGEKAVNLLPEVIFIDLNMPDIDGFQFIDYLKKIWLNKHLEAKLVVLTSSIHQEDEYKAKAISSDIIYMRKPLTLELLAEI